MMFSTCTAFSSIPTPRSWNTLSWGRVIFHELQIHNVCKQLVIHSQTLLTSHSILFYLDSLTFTFSISSLSAALTSFPFLC